MEHDIIDPPSQSITFSPPILPQTPQPPRRILIEQLLCTPRTPRLQPIRVISRTPIQRLRITAKVSKREATRDERLRIHAYDEAGLSVK